MNSNEPEQSAAELRGLLRFAQGLGLDEAIVRLIYETVWWEASEAGASDDERMAEVRKRMLAAARLEG
ncbi:hypothetical protein [Methylorubrum extorquens]|uniref:hypothetical protein n=1 Tax=Methylorubrum extorquens TaxID=408 RepID=UPI002236F261|nr:hypothetical protein [Methylorubrum extorquens]UYW32539.1 hypothetical protein OKB92_26845 [Methylorubrum extorquens]